MLTLAFFVQSGGRYCMLVESEKQDGDMRVRRCKSGYNEGLMNRFSLKVCGRVIVWDKARDRISGKLFTR